MKRISLFDPMLKYTEFIGGQPDINIASELNKKIKQVGYTQIIFYIIIPIIVIIFAIFVGKTMMKKNKEHTPKKLTRSFGDNIPLELRLPQ